MNKIFRSDNPFWIGMGSIFDLFVLNLLWLLCCLPIVTIGRNIFIKGFLSLIPPKLKAGDFSWHSDDSNRRISAIGYFHVLSCRNGHLYFFYGIFRSAFPGLAVYHPLRFCTAC